MGRGSSRILFLVCGVRCRVGRHHTAIGEQEKGWHPTRADTLEHIKTSDISSRDEWAAATTTAAMVGIRKPLQELIDGSPWAKQVQAVGGAVTSDVKVGVVPRGGVHLERRRCFSNAFFVMAEVQTEDISMQDKHDASSLLI